MYIVVGQDKDQRLERGVVVDQDHGGARKNQIERITTAAHRMRTKQTVNLQVHPENLITTWLMQLRKS